MSRRLHPVVSLVSALLLTATLPAQRDAQLTVAPAGAARWMPTWAAAQTAPYGNETLAAGVLDNATLRETVHLSVGGNRIRLHLSNLFGTQPLVLRNVTVAVPATPKPTGSIVPASWKPVLFYGRPGVTIAPGQEAVSDALLYNVRPGADLVVSLSVTSAPTAPTLHAGARTTGFLLAGDHADEPTMPGAVTNTRWYFLSEIEVEQRTPGAAVIAFGDSITDGHGTTTDGNNRWPDDLFRRLQANASTSNVAVVNEGIGGNCVLQVCIGPSAVDRFERDALSFPGAKYLIVMEGINDLGALSKQAPQPAAAHADRVQRLEAAYTQMVQKAHAKGLVVYGATLTPWIGGEYYHPDAQAEADRVAVNTWIRTSKTFDGVLDFEAALRDPARPDRMLPAYDSGDHLHPGPAGYQKMADAIDLSLFAAR